MNKQNILNEAREFVKNRLSGEASGHDWFHVERVCNNSLCIGQKEKADLFIVELASLLHDISDWRTHDGDVSLAIQLAADWMKNHKVSQELIWRICNIIDEVTYRGVGEVQKLNSIEAKVVQDADRLDAIGAIGIARAFAYGGFKNWEIFNPEIKYDIHSTYEEFKMSTGPTINYFYEKILIVGDMMQTKTGKKMASERKKIMESFINQFYKEWYFHSEDKPSIL